MKVYIFIYNNSLGNEEETKEPAAGECTDNYYFCMCDILADAAGIDLYKLV